MGNCFLVSCIREVPSHCLFPQRTFSCKSAYNNDVLTIGQKEFYDENGYLILPVFSVEECGALTEHYMTLRKEPRPGDFSGVEPDSNDPLLKYPRMIHMHRWDDVSLKWALDKRLNAVMTALTGVEPFMVQTMLYFKPPGARGQALHQDNYYLRAQPGTCLAAWMALDDCDEENGCMQVVPGSHTLPILCAEKADTSASFTDVTVPVPPGLEVVPVVMERGEVLFFNGSLIHGSYPNKSSTRFRRALIGHYLTGDAQTVSEWYHPVYKMDGSIIDFGSTQAGGPCGVAVERGGAVVIEMLER